MVVLGCFRNTTGALFWEFRTQKRRDVSVFQNIFFWLVMDRTLFSHISSLRRRWIQFSGEALEWRWPPKKVKSQLLVY